MGFNDLRAVLRSLKCSKGDIVKALDNLSLSTSSTTEGETP